MTDKKESILHSALELFATEGYNAVSTSRIAKKAGVSEGLIFRHFENKKGLLTAIMKDAEARLGLLFGPIIFEEDPKEVLRKTIALPFSQVDESQLNYWRLQFKLKWIPEFNNPEKLKPIIDKLTWAFTELEYEDPQREAYFLNQIVDSISLVALRDGRSTQEGFQELLWSKYDLKH